MAHEWDIDEPKILDIGEEHERVVTLKVGLVGGRVDVLTHEDSPTARLEVQEVSGRPLHVRWDGSALKVGHVRESGNDLFETLKSQLGQDRGRKVSARISISVPTTTVVTVNTVSADTLVNGARNDVSANTVSGLVTLDDITGRVSANTVSGDVECHTISGSLKTNTVSGAVTVQASDVRKVELGTVSGPVTVDLATAAAQVSSSSVSGDVTIRVPGGRGYALQARTLSGHVVVDGVAMQRDRDTRGPGSGGRLTDGDEALVVRAKSVSGDVVVLRSAVSGIQDTAAKGPQDWPAPGTPA